MFIDYYALLEVDFNATSEEIKIAFKKQALKWHPDRNLGKDTTKMNNPAAELRGIMLPEQT